MAFVITSPCKDEKASECIEVCPVNCIEEGEDMFFINPEICIDCGACETVCPAEAIYMEDSVPEEENEYIQLNRKFFEVGNITK
ncbi:4Fe-4S binding protein [Scopulibacillus darangshiensis]|uniref:Ferredoxin n=1 Tax=Scopulibacillus darangshiensis TaxID=442528 RepID=A0A4R2NHT6_9BACL|nr:ferredoxin family protein [Scopulibacillus darangshiensis]TCP20724.1 4Fe-4S binding protein [Scopulibacillus darangshiensis]